MSNRPIQRRSWIPWQTSLRTLLLLSIASGTLAGLFGPDIARKLRDAWSTSPTVQPIAVPSSVIYVGDIEEPNGYFESAETPLR